jgi:hypothetical protein
MKKTLGALIGTIALVAMLTACGSSTDTSATDTSGVDTTSVTDTAPVDSGYTTAEDEFLYDVHHVNNPIIERNTDKQILETGHTVCDTLDSGETVTTISNYLMSTGDYEGDTAIEFVASMVAGAVINLCPEYKYQLPK